MCQSWPGAAPQERREEVEADMRKLDPEATQELYDALTERSCRSFEGYESYRSVSHLEIPGDLAFFVDDLVDMAAKKMKQPAQETLAEILDRGIVSWYTSLSVEECRKVGLPESLVSNSSRVDDVGQEDAETSQLEPVVLEQKKKLAELESMIAQMRKEQKLEREKIVKQKAELQQLRSELDAFPGGAGKAGFGQQYNSYTPLTSHVVMRKGQQNGRANKSNKAAGRR